MPTKTLTLSTELVERMERIASQQGRSLEAVLADLLRTYERQETTATGYPVNYFEQIDAIEADDLQERPPQGRLDREPLE